MATEQLQDYWWKVPAERIHETLFAINKWIDTNQRYQHEADLRHMRLYGNSNVLGLSAARHARSIGTDKISLNIVQSMCDTVTQKIGKNRPKPEFITEGGDRSIQKRAKKLSQFVEGVFEDVKFYEKAPVALRDATVFGPGMIKIYRDGTRLCAERTFVGEIKVIDAEAIHGTPRSMFQVKPLTKELLIALYPGFKDKILKAKEADTSSTLHKGLSNPIEVLEAWHLPSKPGAKDGLHVICIDGATMLHEPYKRDYFPFVMMRWNRRLLGWRPQGLAEQLVGLQVEINKLLMTIQRAFHLFVPKLILTGAANPPKAHVNNEIGAWIHLPGCNPGDYSVHAPSPIAPEIFQHLERLYQKAFEIAGISQLSASSKKPGGLDSGKALREFNDIESERFMLVGQDYEAMHLDAARQFIDLVKEIAEEDPSFAMKTKGARFLESIKWKDVEMEEDKYVMRCFPISSLSSTPSGRIQDIQELMQIGFIDQANGARLMNFPDLEAYMRRANAPIDDIENQIEKMIDDGVYESPEPFQALEKGLPLVQSAYLQAKGDNVAEERLELLRRWMTEAHALIQPASQPTDGQPGMPIGQPIATPAAPPVSNMLPIAPGA